MTDQTTTPPASNKEAAHELEDMLGHLGAHAGPAALRVNMGLGSYWLHTRTLRMAISALRDRQDRIDAVNTAHQAQDGTQLATEQVQKISRLIADLADSEHGVTLDLFTMGIQPTALAAVLRAGMASVVGSSSADAVDGDEPTGLVEHDIDGNLIPDSELPDLARRLLKQNEKLTRELKAHYERALQGQDTGSTPAPEPSRHYSTAVRQLASDILAVDEEHDLKVRGVVNAVLDAAAEHLRDVLKRPRLTPLVVMPQPKDLSGDDLRDLFGRFRAAIADAAADELRILARLDDVRP